MTKGKGKKIDVKQQDLGFNKKLKNVKFKEAFDTTTLAKAEKAIQSSKDVFLQATLEDMQELKGLFDRLSAEAMKQELQRILDLSLSIKSRASTAGHPLASAVAKSLFEFCEKRVKEIDAEKLGIAQVHIKALDQILSNAFDENDESKSDKLMDGLKKLTEKYS